MDIAIYVCKLSILAKKFGTFIVDIKLKMSHELCLVNNYDKNENLKI